MRELMRFPWAVVSGLAMLAIFFAVYFPVAAAGGFGPPNETGLDYGETVLRTGPIRQPACFWSAIAFSISGLAILLWLDLTGPVAGRPMEGRTALSVPLGLLTVWLGPGSMLEHGTLTRTWGWFDAASIHWYGFYMIGFVILRMIRGGTESWCGRILFWVGHAVCCFLVGLWGALDGSVLQWWSVGLLAVTGVMVLVLLCCQGPLGYGFEPVLAWTSFGVGIGMTGVAVLFQVFGGQGEWADDWGHPTWHVLIGLVTFFIFLVLKADQGWGTGSTNPGQATAK